MPQFILDEPANAGEGDDVVIIPEDEILEAEVARIDVRTKPFKDDNGNEIKRVNFKFVIRDGGDFDGRALYGDTSTAFVDHPECKLRNWSQEIMALEGEFPKGFSLDTDQLQGARARIVVGIRKYTKDGVEVQKNYAKDVIRSKNPGGGSGQTQFVEEPF